MGSHGDGLGGIATTPNSTSRAASVRAPDGTLLVADTNNHRVVLIDLAARTTQRNPPPAALTLIYSFPSLLPSFRHSRAGGNDAGGRNEDEGGKRTEASGGDSR